MCKTCEKNPVITLQSGVKLCKSCFIRYFERKVKKTVSQFEMISKTDTVAVAMNGCKDSAAVLHIIEGIAKNHKGIKVSAIFIDEGIGSHRKAALKEVRDMCRKLKVKLHVYSFKKEFGYTLPQMVKRLEMNPCAVCTIFKRYLLNKYSRELKADKLATGHNLDSEAQSIVMNQFRSNVEGSARLGPVTGIVDDSRFVRRIKPLYMMEDREVKLYAKLKKLPHLREGCPHVCEDYRAEIGSMIDKIEKNHPGIKNNIVKSFLATLPALKRSYRTQGKKIRSCRCGEPSVSGKCRVCELLKKLEFK